MTAVYRLLLLSLLSALIGTGLIGCAVFSASAAGAPGVQETVASPAAHGAHEAHAAGTPGSQMPEHDNHGHMHCDGCAQSLLSRAAVMPDAGPPSDDLSVPLSIIPAALQLDAVRAVAEREAWPPGTSPPPLAPRTLTHLKISLLI